MSEIIHYAFPEYIGGYIFPQYIYKYSKLLKSTSESEHKSIKLPEFILITDMVYENRRNRRKIKKVKMNETEENDYEVQLALKYDEFYDMFEENYLNVELMVKYFKEFMELCEILKIDLKNVIYMIKPQKYDIESYENKNNITHSYIIRNLSISDGVCKYAFMKGNPNDDDIIYSLLDDSINEEWFHFGCTNFKINALFINKLLSFDFEQNLKDSYYCYKEKDLKEKYNKRIEKAINFLKNKILNNDKYKALLLPNEPYNRIYFLTKDNYKHLINCDIFFKNMNKKRFDKLSKVSETVDFNVVPCIYKIPISIFKSEDNKTNLNYYTDLDSDEENRNNNLIYLDENNNYRFNLFKHRSDSYRRRKSGNDVLVHKKDLYMLESINILKKNIIKDEFNNEYIKYNIDENELHMKNLANIPNIGTLYFTNRIDLNIIKFLASLGYKIDISYMKYFLNNFKLSNYIEVDSSYITYLQNKVQMCVIDEANINSVEKPDYLYYDTETLYNESKLIKVFSELSNYVDFTNNDNDQTLIYYCITYNLVNTLKYICTLIKKDGLNEVIDKNILQKKIYDDRYFHRNNVLTLFENIYIKKNANNKDEYRFNRYSDYDNDNDTYNKVYLNLSTLDYLVTVHNVELKNYFYEVKNVSMIKYLLSKNVLFDNQTLIYYIKYNYGLFNYFVKKLNYKLPQIMCNDILAFFNEFSINNYIIVPAIVNDIIEHKELYGINEELLRKSFTKKNIMNFISKYFFKNYTVHSNILHMKYKNMYIYNTFIKNITKYTNDYEDLFDKVLKMCIRNRKCKLFSLFASHMPNFNIANYENEEFGLKIHEETVINKFYTFGTPTILDYKLKNNSNTSNDFNNNSDDDSSIDSSIDSNNVFEEREINLIYKENEKIIHQSKVHKDGRHGNNVYNNDILMNLYDNEFNKNVYNNKKNNVLLYNFSNDNIYNRHDYKPKSSIYSQVSEKEEIESKLKELRKKEKKYNSSWNKYDNISFETIYENESISESEDENNINDSYLLSHNSESNSSSDYDSDSS